MANPAFQKIEVVGTSETSLSDATANAVAQASDILGSASWFEVIEQRGSVRDGKITQYQVTVKVGGKAE